MNIDSSVKGKKAGEGEVKGRQGGKWGGGLGGREENFIIHSSSHNE